MKKILDQIEEIEMTYILYKLKIKEELEHAIYGHFILKIIN